MRPRKFIDALIEQALTLRRQGEKWVVVEAMLGDGMKNACYQYTKRRKT